MTNKSIILSMNVSWLPEDLKLYENQSEFLESVIFTFIRFITLVLAIIVHRAFYKLMKRLPGRAINQIMYPYMVHILPIVKVNTKNRYKLWYLRQGSQMNRQVQKCRYNSKVIMAFWENATFVFRLWKRVDFGSEKVFFHEKWLY